MHPSSIKLYEAMGYEFEERPMDAGIDIFLQLYWRSPLHLKWTDDDLPDLTTPEGFGELQKMEERWKER